MFCPLDCWDSCKLKVKSEKYKIKFEGDNFSPYLCWKLNNYFKFSRESSSKINSKNIMLSEGLKNLVEILKRADPKKVLFVKGSGNMGLMQNITKLFFEKYGAVFAVGSTCDGIGEKGILKSRGKSLILPTWVIKNAKNIIIWGRNPYITNIHLLDLIKDKSVLTIDVIKSKTAKKSDFFIQINPNSDYFLALLLSKLVFERNLVKRSDGIGFDKFKQIIDSYSENELIEKCGVNLEKVEFLLQRLLKGAVILEGLGVVKCKECWKTTWAIDSLAYMLDLFGKKDMGVAFLGSSTFGLNNPFKIEHKNRVPLFDVNLNDYDVVFIQGANPLVSFVNKKEWEKLKEKTTIVFGKYYDETAKIVKLFIPTKDFYEKKDIRGSYFHEYVLKTKKLKVKNEKCISEYELTKYLFDEFDFNGLKSEDEYLEEFSKNVEWIDEEFGINPFVNKIPYKNSFFTEDKKFHFLSEKFKYTKKDFEIVTAKHSKALNSQFQRDENIYINPKSKIIMLSWVEKNIKINRVKFSEDVSPDVIFAKGGSVINSFLKSKGKNAYYEWIENENI